MIGVVASSRRRLSTVTAQFGSYGAKFVTSGVATLPTAKPADTAVGDTLAAFLCTNNLTSTWPTLTGFTVVGTPVNGMTLHRKVADGSEPATFNFTRETSTTAAAGAMLVRFPGTHVISVVGFWNGTGGTVTLPDINVPANNSLLFQIVARVNSGAATWTPPAVVVGRVRWNASHDNFVSAAGDEVVAAGQAGTRTWTHDSIGPTRGAIFALTPRAA